MIDGAVPEERTLDVLNTSRTAHPTDSAGPVSYNVT